MSDNVTIDYDGLAEVAARQAYWNSSRIVASRFLRERPDLHHGLTYLARTGTGGFQFECVTDYGAEAASVVGNLNVLKIVRAKSVIVTTNAAGLEFGGAHLEILVRKGPESDQCDSMELRETENEVKRGAARPAVLHSHLTTHSSRILLRELYALVMTKTEFHATSYGGLYTYVP
jgi:hypothetical protein